MKIANGVQPVHGDKDGGETSRGLKKMVADWFTGKGCWRD